MENKPAFFLHPGSLAIGALLTGLGVVLAEFVFGPVLARNIIPKEEALIGGVHKALAEEYLIPKDKTWLMHRAIEGMLVSLDDSYSYFLEDDAELRDLEEESTGNLIGIGAVISNHGFVRYPRPGGPAEKAGILPGDQIISIDGEDSTHMELEELTHHLKGEQDTRVWLGLRRTWGLDKPTFLDVEIARTSMPSITVRQVRMLDEEFGIGHVYIRAFANSTPGELDQALDALERRHLRGLVLDLRFNPGGMLTAAVEVAARFLRGGVVTVRKPRKGEITAEYASPEAGRAANLPVVILLNGVSASGSEVVAGALRDRGAAVIVGERSYGKGVFQQVRRYDQGHFALKFAAGYFVTPSGRIIEGHLDTDLPGGLEPDLHVPDPPGTEISLYQALQYEEPPEKYREQVYAIFPQAEEFRRPEDPAMAAAVELLRQAVDPL